MSDISDADILRVIILPDTEFVKPYWGWDRPSPNWEGEITVPMSST